MTAKVIESENGLSSNLQIGTEFVDEFPIVCKKISQREFLFSGIPIYDDKTDTFDYIDVKMRKLLQSDGDKLEGLDLTKSSSTPTVLSIIVTDWDGRDFITANELRLDKYEEALQALNFCFIKVLQPKFSLTSVK